MTYFEDIEKLLSGFSEKQKEALVSRLEINLYEPKQISPTIFKSKETRKRLKEIERKALKKLHPDRAYPEPGGFECSLCGTTENEVAAMAKHDSGFNICSECINLCAQVLQEKGIE